MNAHKNIRSLSQAMQEAIRTIHREGELLNLAGTGFRSPAGVRVAIHIVMALHERFLITITAESRHRSRQHARLSPTGALVALGLSKHKPTEKSDDDDYRATAYHANGGAPL